MNTKEESCEEDVNSSREGPPIQVGESQVNTKEESCEEDINSSRPNQVGESQVNIKEERREEDINSSQDVSPIQVGDSQVNTKEESCEDPSSRGGPICQECGAVSNGGEHPFVVRQELEEQRKSNSRKTGIRRGKKE